jgi:preprotein translocase subunit SecD
MKPNTRNALLVALGAAACGYLFFKADSFWGLVSAGLIGIWALIYALPVMDAGWRMRVGLATSALLLGFALLWPTLGNMSSGKIPCPAYVRDRVTHAIVPGLDLSGGMRLVYTVEVEEAIRDKRDHFADEMRQELATIFQLHTGDGLITRQESEKLADKVHIGMPESAVIRLKFADKADLSKIDERFDKKFLGELSESRGPAPDEVTFKIKTEVESQIRTRAVDQAKDTVSRRVDELALREFNLTVRDEDIIIEVPGEDQKTFDDIKEIIRKTARLEFKMVDDETNFFAAIKDDTLPEGEGISIFQENAPDGPGKTSPTSFARIAKREKESMADTLARLKKWTATLNVPDDHQVGYEPLTSYDADTGKSEDEGWRTMYLFARADVTGDYITDASVQQDQQQGLGTYYVALTFSPAGAERFEEVTGANVGRRFAIILDDAIDSAPVIKTKIGGGRASITMGAGDPEKQLQDARKLELVLRSGALPAPITPSNESLIGQTLGADSIHEGVRGMIVGISLVLGFMAFYYRKSGVVADLAVLFNLFLQMAVLASFSATMTLPGICGLALTVGMSVDANVLINERIREELRSGRSVRAAVEAGYNKAFSSIFDGHVTVFISGLILAQYGTGPVKGFAITLIIGIMCSLFTGVFCTRLVFDWWVRGAKVKRLSVGAEF